MCGSLELLRKGSFAKFGHPRVHFLHVWTANFLEQSAVTVLGFANGLCCIDTAVKNAPRPQSLESWSLKPTS